MAVEYTRRKVLLSLHMTTTPGFGIAWSSWNCSISRKKNSGSWKNSGTFYGYCSCVIWSVSDGPQFCWTGCAFYGKLSSAAKKYSLCKLPVICLCVFNPHIKTVMWWIHIEDIFTLDAEFVLDKWTVINDDTNFLQSKRSTRLCWNTSIVGLP